MMVLAIALLAQGRSFMLYKCCTLKKQNGNENMQMSNSGWLKAGVSCCINAAHLRKQNGNENMPMQN
ncbi:hypothetical protein Y1Q_0019963 [Alligator mississippiensis]|uniref:Uncharacterized protein n=1 Tax=Alligator mississippiensis TaxID=8496 RepID=A0A151PDV9_ALLMI|nr:hypothetical protein Y1Q_0019963 [Alligator mississippiensis]